MPFYRDLKQPPRPASEPPSEAERKRTIARLLALRDALATSETAPPPRTFGTLLLGTWNLREFDSSTWGYRLRESYAYIAEIIDRFDLVAIQEVREDLAALKALMQRLGPNWDFIASDVTKGKPGNRERLAFLFDKRKVRFLGVAGELVLPPVQTGKGTYAAATQIARTPLMAAFQVGWTKFLLTTVHIVYGEDGREPAARVEEISQVGRFLRERADDPTDLTGNMVLLGDFNIFTQGDKTYKALVEDGGFTIPAGIKDLSSDLGQSKKYDQIAYRCGPERFRETGRAGVIKYYEHVFTADDADTYRPYIDRYIEARHKDGKTSPKSPETTRAARSQYGTWRTYQMSDHYPLWAEFQVDFSDDYLRGIGTETPA